MKQTREQSVATALLAYLASGGTLDSIMTELPAFKTQLQTAFDWMKSNAQCTAAEVQRRAEHLRDVIQSKEDAITSSRFDDAAEFRAEECTLSESMGLGAPIGPLWNTFARLGVDEQIRNLSQLLGQNGKH